MSETYGSMIVAETLKEMGVKWIAGMMASGMMNIVEEGSKLGIRYYAVRHEQTGAYMADGWARSSRSPGVCLAGLVPGSTNLAPGLSHANLCNSPVFAMVQAESLGREGIQAFETIKPEFFAPITKWTHRITHSSMLSYWVRKGLHETMLYPPGPIAIQIPWTLNLERGDLVQQKRQPVAKLPKLQPGYGDPRDVEEVVKLILQTEEVLLITGEGVFWEEAGSDLCEFIERFQVPVNMRRVSRGCVAESHPLAVKVSDRQELIDAAKIIVILGLRVSYLDNWFEPPNWNPKAKYIQIQPNEQEVFLSVPTERCIIGGVKNILRQMIDCAKDLNAAPVLRSKWTKKVTECKERGEKRRRDRREKFAGIEPVHPDILSSTVLETAEKDATIILDSNSMAGFLTERVTAVVPGQVLDAGLQSGLGHSIGMGIGAQLARPGKQVICFPGDGGIGIGGMDIETAVRYQLPVVYIICNNSTLVSKLYKNFFFPEQDTSDCISGIRYDKMFREFGCHVDHVETPKTLKRALVKAFRSGKTSAINVTIDDSFLHRYVLRHALIDTFVRNKAADLSGEAKKEMKRMTWDDVTRTQKELVDMGITNVSSEELAEVVGLKLPKRTS